MNAIYHPRDVFPIVDIRSLWIKDLKNKEHIVKGEDILPSRKVARKSSLQDYPLNLQNFSCYFYTAVNQVSSDVILTLPVVFISKNSIKH